MLRRLANAFSRSVQRRGVLGTLTFVPLAAVRTGVSALENLHPVRIRARRAAAQFDEQLGVDTRGIVNLSDLKIDGNNQLHGQAYQATGNEVFRDMMNALPDELSDFTFVDVGSGKGRTLLLATAWPFERIIGVEFSRELHETAQRNIERARYPWPQRCVDVSSVCCDATAWTLPNDRLVLYFYNPFTEPVMRAVVQNIEQSIQQADRDVYVVYYNPEQRELLDDCGLFTRHVEGDGWAIYRHKRESARTGQAVKPISDKINRA